MRFSMLRAAVITASTALVLTATAGPAAAGAAKPDNDGEKATPFAFRAVSFGTRVRGGQIPVSSGTTS